MPDPILIEGWPALLTHEMAARYLSLEAAAFDGAVEQFRVWPVEPVSGCTRWRRSDLDRLVKRLATKSLKPLQAEADGQVIRLDRETLQQLGNLVSRQLASQVAGTAGDYLTIRDVTAEFSISRSGIYKLISEGKLEAKHLGRRTLIKRADIMALLA